MACGDKLKIPTNYSIYKNIFKYFFLLFIFYNLGGCYPLVLDEDDFEIHAHANFVADGHLYQREWDFVLHRQGHFQTEVGHKDAWTVTQAGFLVPLESGRDVLLALDKENIPHRMWYQLINNGTAHFQIPGTVTDKSISPTKIIYPKKYCSSEYPIINCEINLILTTKPKKIEYPKLDLPWEYFDGPYFVFDESSHKIVDSISFFEPAIEIRYDICSSGEWRNSRLTPNVLHKLEAAAASGLAISDDGPNPCSKNISLQGGIHDPQYNPPVYSLSYEGAGRWSASNEPSVGWVRYHISDITRDDIQKTKPEDVNPRGSDDAWEYVKQIKLPSGKTFHIQPRREYRGTYYILDATNDQLYVLSDWHALE